MGKVTQVAFPFSWKILAIAAMGTRARSSEPLAAFPGGRQGVDNGCREVYTSPNGHIRTGRPRA